MLVNMSTSFQEAFLPSFNAVSITETLFTDAVFMSGSTGSLLRAEDAFYPYSLESYEGISSPYPPMSLFFIQLIHASDNGSILCSDGTSMI